MYGVVSGKDNIPTTATWLDNKDKASYINWDFENTWTMDDVMPQLKIFTENTKGLVVYDFERLNPLVDSEVAQSIDD